MARMFPNLAAITPASISAYWVASLKGALVGSLVWFAVMIVFSIALGPILAYLIGQLVGLGVATRLYGHIYAGRVLDAGLKDNTWLSTAIWAGIVLQLIGGIAAMAVLSVLGWLILMVVSIIVGTKKSAYVGQANAAPQADMDNVQAPREVE